MEEDKVKTVNTPRYKLSQITSMENQIQQLMEDDELSTLLKISCELTLIVCFKVFVTKFLV